MVTLTIWLLFFFLLTSFILFFRGEKDVYKRVFERCLLPAFFYIVICDLYFFPSPLTQWKSEAAWVLAVVGVMTASKSSIPALWNDSVGENWIFNRYFFLNKKTYTLSRKYLYTFSIFLTKHRDKSAR